MTKSFYPIADEQQSTFTISTPVWPTWNLRIDCDGTLQRQMSDGSWEPVPRVKHEWGEQTDIGYRYCVHCGAVS